MTTRLFAIILLAGALSGCKGVDGVYLPGCPAYAGDRIELEGGRFTWDKFTDQVKLDADGNPVDPFPGYPRTGNYTIEGDNLTLIMADDGARQAFHLYVDNGRVMLLTDAQQANLQTNGSHDECALTRTTEE